MSGSTSQGLAFTKLLEALPKCGLPTEKVRNSLSKRRVINSLKLTSFPFLEALMKTEYFNKPNSATPLDLAKISNEEILSRLDRLAKSERKITHLILWHILEVESRKLHL